MQWFKTSIGGGQRIALAIIFALILAVGAVFTLPGESLAATGNPPKNVKITKAKYSGGAVHYTVKWSKPSAGKYKLSKYEYQIWLVKGKSWSGTSGTTKTSISGTAPQSNGKTFKVRVRTVYKYKGKTYKSKWVTKKK